MNTKQSRWVEWLCSNLGLTYLERWSLLVWTHEPALLFSRFVTVPSVYAVLTSFNTTVTMAHKTHSAFRDCHLVREISESWVKDIAFRWTSGLGEQEGVTKLPNAWSFPEWKSFRRFRSPFSISWTSDTSVRNECWIGADCAPLFSGPSGLALSLMPLGRSQTFKIMMKFSFWPQACCRIE